MKELIEKSIKENGWFDLSDDDETDQKFRFYEDEDNSNIITLLTPFWIGDVFLKSFSRLSMRFTKLEDGKIQIDDRGSVANVENDLIWDWHCSDEHPDPDPLKRHVYADDFIERFCEDDMTVEKTGDISWIIKYVVEPEKLTKGMYRMLTLMSTLSSNAFTLLDWKAVKKYKIKLS